MDNALNYLKHTLHNPNVFYHQIEHCIPEKVQIEKTFSRIHKIAQYAMPLITLHKPMHNTYLFTCSSIRVISSLADLKHTQIFTHEQFKIFIRASLATLAFAATYFNFTIGLYVTTMADIVQTTTLLFSGNGQILEHILSLATSILYMASIYSATLEIMLMSLILQVITHAKQAFNEFYNDDGDWLMGVSKLLMVCIRSNQAHHQVKLIKRRNILKSIARLQDLRKRIEKSKKVSHLYFHRLNALKEAIANSKSTLIDAKGNEIDFGSYMGLMGKNVVKGMNLRFKDQGDFIELEFKITNTARKHLNEVIEDLKADELSDLLSLTNHSFSKITIKQEKKPSNYPWICEENLEINFKDCATVSIGQSQENYIDYNTVKIKMNSDLSHYSLHEVLSLLDLDEAMCQSTEDDIQRFKVWHLFKTLNPEQAKICENEDAFFTQSIDELKQDIINRDSNMQLHFQDKLDKLEFEETIPGKMNLRCHGLSDEFKELGAGNLTAMVITPWDTQTNDMVDRVCDIAQLGLLSPELREKGGLGYKGLDAMTKKTGSHEYVCTQMQPQHLDTWDSVYSNGFEDEVRVTYNLSALENKTYQYHDDNYANKNPEFDMWGLDSQWPSLHEFIEDQVKYPSYDHEIMVADRVKPESLETIEFRNNDLKQTVIQQLEEYGHIKTDVHGCKTYNGKQLDDVFTINKKPYTSPYWW